MEIIDNVRLNIRRIMKEKNINQSELSERAKFSQVYLSDLLRGQKGTGLKINTLVSIAEALNVPLEEILLTQDKLQKNILDAMPDKTYEYINFFDVKVSAGTGLQADDEVSRILPVEKSFIRRIGVTTDCLAAVEVAGDSMEPTLRNGDLVIVLKNEHSLDFAPGIYVIRDISGLKVKRLDIDKYGVLIVTSDNQYYKPQTYTKDEADNGQITIIGRVVGKIGVM